MEQESRPNAPTPGAAMSLPVGTRLGEFELLSVIGEGGFSIVYLAQDHSLQRTVAIKEYLPGAIAFRDSEGEVRPRFDKYEGTFKTGLQSFLNEARILAQFEHPALIRIHRFWEQNGTAYMVMQYCKGKTLRKVLQENPQKRQDEVWIKQQVIFPVLDALRLLHAKHYYHRDLSPDNIMVLDTGAPMLLDFGAARQVIGDMTQALTVILKPGFAPIEQYADDESMRQGAWTDIYGVGAVLYFVVTGKAPVASVARLVKDPLKKLQLTAEYGISASFAQAIDHSLAVFPNERPQSVDEFQNDLMRIDLEINISQNSAINQTISVASAVAAAVVQESIVPEMVIVPAEMTGSLSSPMSSPEMASVSVGNKDRQIVETAEHLANVPTPTPEGLNLGNAAGEYGSVPAISRRSSKRWGTIVGCVVAVLAIGVVVAWYTTKDQPVVGQSAAEQLPVNPRATQAAASDADVVGGVSVSSKVEPPAGSTAPAAAAVTNAPEALVPQSGPTGAVVTQFPNAAQTSASIPLATTAISPTPVASVQAETKPVESEPPQSVDPIVSGRSKLAEDPAKLPKTNDNGKPKDAVSELLSGNRSTGDKASISTGAVAPVSGERLADVRPSKPGAYLRLSVQPWGRVILDGQDKGISPPVMRIWLPEGEHRVVLENDNQQRHSGTVRIDDKKDVTFSHKF